ncbi:MAG TPA: 5'-methylthioadenosine/S-adenosylhomocysteine nucleosidase [Tetragenococcus sp.]|nr:5'-methylthioadenosine/S-adenosylhomocysteine nucleosidase [Tetragenococcus sp.]
MIIGIIAAMQLEISDLKKHFSQGQQKTIIKNEFYQVVYGNNELVFVCCGQGKTNATIFTQLLIQEFQTDIIINIGVCGGLNKEDKIFDLYLGEHYYHYDIRLKQALEKYPFQPYFEADPELLKQIKAIAPKIKTGNFGSGEGFVSSEKQKQELSRSFALACVDMESASIAQCCWFNNIRFVAIRCLCDKADSSAVYTSEEIQQQAMRRTNQVLLAYLDSL